MGVSLVSDVLLSIISVGSKVADTHNKVNAYNNVGKLPKNIVESSPWLKEIIERNRFLNSIYKHFLKGELFHYGLGFLLLSSAGLFFFTYSIGLFGAFALNPLNTLFLVPLMSTGAFIGGSLIVGKALEGVTVETIFDLKSVKEDREKSKKPELSLRQQIGLRVEKFWKIFTSQFMRDFLPFTASLIAFLVSISTVGIASPISLLMLAGLAVTVAGSSMSLFMLGWDKYEHANSERIKNLLGELEKCENLIKDKQEEKAEQTEGQSFLQFKTALMGQYGRFLWLIGPEVALAGSFGVLSTVVGYYGSFGAAHAAFLIGGAAPLLVLGGAVGGVAVSVGALAVVRGLAISTSLYQERKGGVYNQKLLREYFKSKDKNFEKNLDLSTEAEKVLEYLQKEVISKANEAKKLYQNDENQDNSKVVKTLDKLIKKQEQQESDLVAIAANVVKEVTGLEPEKLMFTNKAKQKSTEPRNVPQV